MFGRRNDLPTELWMETLKMLAFSDLKSISLANHRLRALASPRLFRCLCLSAAGSTKEAPHWTRWAHPQPSDANKEPRTPSEMTDLLQFYGSGKIAPLVRKVWLAHHSNHLPLQPSAEAVFSLLPKFPKLDSIGFISSHIDARFLRKFNELPALVSICMESWTSFDLELPRLSLKAVQLLGGRREDLMSWPFTIQPDLLEFLHIDNTAFPDVSSLPNLRTLRLGYHFDDSVPLCVKFLTSCPCPSLDTLIFCRDRYEAEGAVDVDGLPPNIIPRLSTYQGPTVHAHVFAAGGLLRNATLWAPTSGRPQSPEQVTSSLRRLHALAPNLVELTVDVAVLAESVIKTAFQFIHLEALRLNTTRRERISIKDLFSILKSLHLPPNLRLLQFHSLFRATHVGIPGIANMVKAYLTQTNPHLHHLSVQVVSIRKRVICAYRCETRSGFGSTVAVDSKIIWEPDTDSEASDTDDDSAA